MNIQEEIDTMLASGEFDKSAPHPVLFDMAERWFNEQVRKRQRSATRKVESAVVRFEARAAATSRVAELTTAIAKKASHVWTDVLDQSFTLPTGDRVTWGAATIAQHEMRADSLQVMATSTLETASRHRAAVRDIRAAGVTTLQELS